MNKKDKKTAAKLGKPATFKVTSVKNPRWELEYVARACGCRVIADSQQIEYCPMHNLAPEMLALTNMIYELWQKSPSEKASASQEAAMNILQIIENTKVQR